MHSLRVGKIFGSYFDGFLLQLGCEKKCWVDRFVDFLFQIPCFGNLFNEGILTF